MSAAIRVRWQEGDPALHIALDRALAPDAAPGARLHTGPHRTIETFSLPPFASSASPAASDAVREALAPSESARVPGSIGADHALRVVAKRYRRRGPGASALRLRDRLLRRTPEAREWRALSALHAAGLPVPEPLARGSLPGGEAIVVMRHVGRHDLAAALRAAGPGTRRRLLARLAELVERLHAAGFVHGDLHLGNLRADGETIQLLDLHRARRSTRRRARARDRARLLHSVEHAVGDGELLGVLRQALAAGLSTGDRPARAKGRAESAEHALDVARRTFLRDRARGRARRRLRAGRDWRRLVFEAPRRTGLADLDTDAGVDARAIEDGLLHANAVRSGPPRRDGRVEIEEIEVEGRRWIRKHVRAGSLRRALADRIRGSSAARAFARAQRDALISTRSAKPLAYLERRAAGGVVESTLLLERVGDVDLDAYRPSDAAQARRVAIALARWLAEQHAVGLSHRDAKGGNVRLAFEGERVRFWWVDLEDLIGPRRLGPAARLRALVQLNASLADEAFDAAARRAALEAYHARLPFRRPLGEVAREIHAASLARAHRYRGVGPGAACSAEGAISRPSR